MVFVVLFNNNLYGWKRKDRRFEKWPNTQLMVEFHGDAQACIPPKRRREQPAGACGKISAAQFSRRRRQDAVLIEQCTYVCFTVKTSKGIKRK